MQKSLEYRNKRKTFFIEELGTVLQKTAEAVFLFYVGKNKKKGRLFGMIMINLFQ